jgi:hypothetical protein
MLVTLSFIADVSNAVQTHRKNCVCMVCCRLECLYAKTLNKRETGPENFKPLATEGNIFPINTLLQRFFHCSILNV